SDRYVAAAGPDDLPAVLEHLVQRRAKHHAPWNQPDEELRRQQVLHYFLQFLPTVLVDGCWLQSGLKVGTAFTPVGASLTGLYAHHVRAVSEDPGRHLIADYRAAY